MRRIAFFLLFAASIPCMPLAAEPYCQRLDTAASMMRFSINLGGAEFDGRIAQADGWLLYDDDRVELSKLRLKIPASGIRLTTPIEENPLVVGMLNTLIAKPMDFRSSKVASLGKSRFHIFGTATIGGKEMPARFQVDAKALSPQRSRFHANTKSDDAKEALGMSASAEGNFDMIFSVYDKSFCSL